jgi:hypothetical protein
LTTMRTNRFEPHPAVLAKDRIRQILALALRANHDGNQSQLGCIVPDSFKPGLSVHSEGSKQCIVPGYAESKLKNCDGFDACLTENPNRLFLVRGLVPSASTNCRKVAGCASDWGTNKNPEVCIKEEVFREDTTV